MRNRWNSFASLQRGLVAALVAACAAPALAQGYAVSVAADEALELPPDARLVEFGEDAVGQVIELPFRFHTYGEPHSNVFVSAHGYVIPGESSATTLTVSAEFPSGAGFPLETGRADGALAPLWRDGPGAAFVRVWTHGAAPTRRFVVEWPNGDRGTQLQLHEGTDDITFAYRSAPAGQTPTSGEVVDPAPSPRRFVRGLDERGGGRSAVPAHAAEGTGAPPVDTLRFVPRAALFHPEGTGKELIPAAWLDVRKEATVPEGCTKRCTYLAKGRHTFHVRDRALLTVTDRGGLRRQPTQVREGLLAEDRSTFGGEQGDSRRWVRQVLDGKIILLPVAPGAQPLRVWFRIIEYFSLDERGNTLTDHHTWNLRWMLSNAFRDERRREPIDGYWAWKAMARGRLSVGKLFAAQQDDDGGRQYSSGRTNEYLLWSGRLRRGTRGALGPYASPTDGWIEFFLREEDMQQTQHAEAGDLRFVADPNYVDGHYEYVIDALDNAYGWITGRAVPPLPVRDEGFDSDPGRVTAPITPR